jgi:hypothetical protein
MEQGDTRSKKLSNSRVQPPPPLPLVMDMYASKWQRPLKGVLCLQVAEYAAKLEQYDRAIQIYEQVGRLLFTFKFDALK